MRTEAEVRNFKMHPKLLFDVIQRQAGSLAKAILEGIMNSVDAGAATCTITLDADRLTIADDGKGFRSREEIEQFFEVFGQPHTAAEGKTYATFRMGRGQLFAFGVNRWCTGSWRMDVDIKGRGLDYTLGSLRVPTPGCEVRVDLYDPLLPSGIVEATDLIARWAKYAPIPVLFNGTQISSDPAGAKWDHVLDDAYIRITQGQTLAVYNLGIHVFDLPSYRLGCGGEVVSRRQLKVNFARNDVQSDCPVWKAVSKVVDQKATRQNVRSITLDEGGRARIAVQMRQGLLDYKQVAKSKVFTAVTGRHYSPHELYFRNAFTTAPQGSRIGDKVHQLDIYFVFADETLTRFGFAHDLAGMVAWLDTYLCRLSVPRRGVALGEAAAGMVDTYEILPEVQWSAAERAWAELGALSGRFSDYDRDNDYNVYPPRRKIVIGSSTTADGWTDGATYVAIGREFLARHTFDVAGFVAVGVLLLHEFCHGAPDTGQHVHDQAFYETFHNRSEQLGEFVAGCVRRLPAALERANKKATKAVLKSQDRLELAARAVAGQRGVPDAC